jgi:hypothetical protein
MGLVPEGGWNELLREDDEEAREHVRVVTRTVRPRKGNASRKQ